MINVENGSINILHKFYIHIYTNLYFILNKMKSRNVDKTKNTRIYAKYLSRSANFRIFSKIKMLGSIELFRADVDLLNTCLSFLRLFQILIGIN